jgi:hypothetical protein
MESSIEILTIIYDWFKWSWILSVMEWFRDFIWLSGTLFIYLYALYAIVKITFPWIRKS